MIGFAAYASVALIGYLLGSIPTGQIVGTVLGVDLTTRGSGKTGATNTLRTLGTSAAIVVLLGDLAKGIVAILISRSLFHGLAGEATADVIAGMAAIIGHNWSIFIGFKGGRGVVVSFAVFLMLYPLAALMALLVAALVVFWTRFVSLASLVGALVGAILLMVAVLAAGYPRPYIIFAVAASLVILLRHTDNIDRLRSGKERKIGQRA